MGEESAAVQNLGSFVFGLSLKFSGAISNSLNTALLDARFAECSDEFLAKSIANCRRIAGRMEW